MTHTIGLVDLRNVDDATRGEYWTLEQVAESLDAQLGDAERSFRNVCEEMASALTRNRSSADNLALGELMMRRAETLYERQQTCLTLREQSRAVRAAARRLLSSTDGK